MRGASAVPLGLKIRRFLAEWPVVSAMFLTVIILGAVAAPWAAPYGIQEGRLEDGELPPILFGGNASHILGTDHVGNDLLSRTLYGGRISLTVASIVLAAGATIGTVLGLLAGYRGGALDELLMRLVDLKNSIPFILIILIATVIFGASLRLLLILLSIWLWSSFARQVRAEVLYIKELDYVKLALVAGASTPRILSRHILPGVLNTVLVVATHMVGSVILLEATLSFLGAGVPPPTPSWGSMVAQGRIYISTSWWITVVPGVAIGLTVMSFTFLGDWLRDRLDPRLRHVVE